MNIINKHKYNSKLNSCGEALWVEVNKCLAYYWMISKQKCHACVNMNQIKSKKEITIKIYI